MNPPLVSIIIPSFNQGRFLREAIDSCLEQDYRPLEILVLDGGSTDETLDVLRSYDIPELQWWSERDAGVCDAVNKGLAKARGEILTIQSSDDAFLPGAIRACVDALQKSPGAGLAYGDLELIDADSKRTGADIQGSFDLAHYLGRFQYVPQPGTCFTRLAMEHAGGWRDEFSYAADADYWLRIAVDFPVLKLPRLLARYRYHEAQRDQQRAKIARDWAGAVKDLIASGRLTHRQRRFARMGIHLANFRYAPTDAWKYRTACLYAAMWANPGALLDSHFPRSDLIREPVWALLSRFKRKLGLRPRGTS